MSQEISHGYKSTVIRVVEDESEILQMFGDTSRWFGGEILLSLGLRTTNGSRVNIEDGNSFSMLFK